MSQLAARMEFPNNSNVYVQNLTVTNQVIGESSCGINAVFRTTLVNYSMNLRR